MSKTYRAWDPDQTYLLPPSPRDWLPDGDLVYFMLDVIRILDLSAITGKYEKEDRGAPPYHPRMMVTLLLYSYCVGVYSSRRIQKRCERDAAYRMIVGDDVPDFRTISDFRKLHLPELQGLFVEVLKLCAEAGLVKVGLVSLDGAKVKANASRHKAMSYEYMQKEEQRLHKEIAELLAKAKSADEAEDALHGSDKRGDELPEELARRKSRLARIQEAKRALETQALKAARGEEARRDTKDEQRRAAGKTPRKRKPVDTAPKPKAQYNFTDPESKIMKVSNKGFDQCGNAQAVANEAQIIIAADVTPQANDKRQVVPMVEQSQENLQAAGVDEKIGAFDADTGYFSEENVSYLEGEEIDPYISTERLKHHEKIPLVPKGRPPKDLTAKQRMARKLRTKKGRETYAKRKGMIEPIFGQIKQARGFRQFLLRGMEKMRGEWRLLCLTHNHGPASLSIATRRWVASVLPGEAYPTRAGFMTRHSVLVVSLAWFASGFAGTQAAAGPVTWSFAGEITRVTDDNDFLQGAVVVGSTFSGSLTFESATPDGRPEDPTVAEYRDGLLMMSGQVGTLDFLGPLSNPSRFDVLDIPGSDGFVLEVNVEFVELEATMRFNLFDFSGTVFSSDSLPVLPPDLGSIDATLFQIFHESQAAPFSVSGGITFLVPEPTSVLLLGAGLLLPITRRLIRVRCSRRSVRPRLTR